MDSIALNCTLVYNDKDYRALLTNTHIIWYPDCNGELRTTYEGTGTYVHAVDIYRVSLSVIHKEINSSLISIMNEN